MAVTTANRQSQCPTTLSADVIDRVAQLGARATYFEQAIRDRLIEHRQYIETRGEDMPAISNWRWEG